MSESLSAPSDGTRGVVCVPDQLRGTTGSAGVLDGASRDAGGQGSSDTAARPSADESDQLQPADRPVGAGAWPGDWRRKTETGIVAVCSYRDVCD